MSKIRPAEEDGSSAPLLLIVVGAHLHAERVDRALGYRLREAIVNLMQRAGESSQSLDVVVCSDLWYLNQPDLMVRPTIAVGGPGVNAATAHYMNRLPVVFMIEGSLEVRMSPELRPPAAAIWGMTDAATEQAVMTFIERYVGGFVRALGAT
jgi:hypothetical protein